MVFPNCPAVAQLFGRRPRTLLGSNTKQTCIEDFFIGNIILRNTEMELLYRHCILGAHAPPLVAVVGGRRTKTITFGLMLKALGSLNR